jgi:phage tail protein X
MQVNAHQGDTLDLLCWRNLGTTAGVLEAAYLLNPGLAELGPVLPEGRAVILPERPASALSTRETVNLWD